MLDVRCQAVDVSVTRYLFDLRYIYTSFNHFKTACIVHGVYARYMQGQKSPEGVDLDYYRERIGISIELSKQAAAELS